jgi:hypothetical protein
MAKAWWTTKTSPPLSIRNQLCETCASQQDQNQQRKQLGELLEKQKLD